MFKIFPIAMTLVCVTLFADVFSPSSKKKEKCSTDFHQGDEALPTCIPEGYSPSAITKLKRDDAASDVFFDFSFLYYYASLDGLSLANNRVALPGGTTVSPPAYGQVISQSFGYSPAFKVGLGAVFEEWEVSGQYIWIRQTQNMHKNAPPLEVGAESGSVSVWDAENWFYPPLLLGKFYGNRISSEWQLGMDIGDLTASSPYYQGRKSIILPFFGLRTAWIRNSLDIHMPLPLLTGNPLGVSKNQSHAWLLGPRFGGEFHCLLGAGTRIQGTIAAAALYTAFTLVEHYEYVTNYSPAIREKFPSTISTLTPELELSLGTGWGMYLGGEAYHLDVSANYDFLVFWNQNVMRQLLDAAFSSTGSSSGNLYLQGLNIMAKVDF
ncbi:MAG: hypothetical protein KGI80_03365 [Verrucomicrobiota bacterium]|nr:hypothetical protein [Verrucomicrobiota bacterium]